VSKPALHLRMFIFSLLLPLFLAACGQSDAANDPTAVPQIPDSASFPSENTQPTTAESATSASAATAAVTTTEVVTDETVTSSAALTETVAAAELPTQPPAEPTALPSFDPATTQIAVSQVVGNLASPLFVTHAGDGSNRMFVVEKEGRIRIVQDGALLEAPFLAIVERVGSSSSEQGLLGLAFPPNYTESGSFFVNYTDRAGDSVVARYQVTEDANLADPASEFMVIQYEQPAPNHNGGMLLFGPDGMLWIGTGDGGSAGDPLGNGQNPQAILGKMLRLDVTSDPSQPYIIPADNPWVTEDWGTLDVRDEIWALGLRNPWRYSFDRATGDLWIADVGQFVYEEVNVVLAGSTGGINFGWNIMEGMHCYGQDTCNEDGLTLPILEYTHEGHCSVTGGYVYRGAAYPQLNGVYFYGDYCSGHVWAAYPDGNGAWQNVLALESTLTLSSFGEDESGELYLVDYSGGVYKLTVE